MNEATNSTYYHKLQRRREQVDITLKHLNNERHGLKQNMQSMDHNAYLRIQLLDRVSGWYYEETSAIEKAFARLNEGSYGFCLECQKSIETHWLDLYLDAEFCLECTESREY